MNRVDVDLTEPVMSAEPAGPEAAADIVEAVDVVDADAAQTKGLPPHAKLQDDGSVLLPLHFPRSITVKRGEAVVEDRFTAFAMRRLNGQDLRMALQAKPDVQPIILMSQSTGIKRLICEKLFDKMDLSDIDAVSQVLDFFGSNGRKTGR